MATTIDTRKEVVRRAFEAWDEGETDAFDEVYAEGVLHPGRDISGVDGLKAAAETWYEAFPDLSHTVTAMIAEGGWVATLFVVSGTHTDSFRGIAPTGESFEMHGMALERVEDGRIVERWVVEDRLDLYEQLGVVDRPMR